jgi:hypothetical protein
VGQRDRRKRLGKQRARGELPGSPNSSTAFPQTMKVDWVRVYAPSDGG